MPALRRSLLSAMLAMASCIWTLPVRAQTLEDVERIPPIGDPQSTAASTTDAIAGSTEAIEPGALIESGETIELVPSPDAGWWRPNLWFSSALWDFGAELGLNGSEGNAQSLSILSSLNGKRETEGNLFEWDLKYGKSQAGGVETQHYSLFNSRWDWKFTPLWFLYNKNTLEYDEFKAFDLRLVLSGGLGRNLIKTEITTLTARLGAGVSREFGGPDDEWVPEANLGGEYEHKLNARQKLKVTSDYYPAWENFEDYRVVTNAFWEILLSEETNLSLKLGAINRYDSTPNGAVASDIDYFVTLLWKL